jgi:hypothetical protein
MSWTRYLFHDFFTASELNRMDARFRRLRQARTVDVQSRGNMLDRIDELEDDLGRLTLFAQTLAEACVRNGLLTREQISTIAQELDLADGKQDGKLDPSVMRPKEQQRPERPQSTAEYLHDLEKRRRQSPGEFLSDLEQDERKR